MAKKNTGKKISEVSRLKQELKDEKAKVEQVNNYYQEERNRRSEDMIKVRILEDQNRHTGHVIGDTLERQEKTINKFMEVTRWLINKDTAQYPGVINPEIVRGVHDIQKNGINTANQDKAYGGIASLTCRNCGRCNEAHMSNCGSCGFWLK